jgi:hypothetical protein
MKIQVVQKIVWCMGSVVALGGASAWGTTSDGTVIGATKIVDHGPDAQRYTIVLIGEGYQQSEQTKFAQDAQHFVDVFFDTPPFKTNCSIFNVWRIDVASTDSGADDPATCNDGSTGSGAMPKTYFDATFCGDGNIRRLLTSNNATAISVANVQVPGWDSVVVIVNSTEYGGSGGQIATTSISGTDWPLIAIHEYGHSAFALGDEYEYYAGCGVDPPGTHDNHTAVEPAAANLTVETNAALVKWHTLFYPGIAIPTTTNADCTKCDPQGDPFPGEQRVGLYEGADYFHCKAYRPVFDCKFRHLSADFCPVCRQRMLQVLQPFQPANSPPVCNAGGPYVAECAGANTSVALDGSASSDADCNTITFTWTGPFVGGTATGPKPTVQFSGTGVFTVNLAVSDGTATTTCSTTVTVQDTTPPSITCPADIVRSNDPGKCSAVVTFPDPSASDICSAVTVACSPASGSIFQKGTTAVTCTATDAGNLTATCNFSVTVNDTEPPKVKCSVANSSLWPPNHNLVNVGLTVAATDNCPGQVSIGVQVFSDEGDTAPTGEGNFSPDAKDIAPGTLRLRQERNGAADGRVYLVVTSATDTSGNVGFDCCTVVVPHDQSAASVASVNAQAASAQAFCSAHSGAPPAGFVPVGGGPVIGPKQ